MANYHLIHSQYYTPQGPPPNKTIRNLRAPIGADANNSPCHPFQNLTWRIVSNEREFTEQPFPPPPPTYLVRPRQSNPVQPFSTATCRHIILRDEKSSVGDQVIIILVIKEMTMNMIPSSRVTQRHAFPVGISNILIVVVVTGLLEFDRRPVIRYRPTSRVCSQFSRPEPDE